MKIIYEIGDIIEVYDDVEVPFSLGASHIKLLKKLPKLKKRSAPQLWEIEVIDSIGQAQLIGKKFTLNQKWFSK